MSATPIKRICFVVGTDDQVYKEFVKMPLENKVLILRGNGFHYNQRLLFRLEENKMLTNTAVYTNDETMLNYAYYDEKIHSRHISFLFGGDPYWYELEDLHPNLRMANNITSMFQRGVFFDDYESTTDEIINK